jgi:hypothetical protein
VDSNGSVETASFTISNEVHVISLLSVVGFLLLRLITDVAEPEAESQERK